MAPRIQTVTVIQGEVRFSTHSGTVWRGHGHTQTSDRYLFLGCHPVSSGYGTATDRGRNVPETPSFLPLANQPEISAQTERIILKADGDASDDRLTGGDFLDALLSGVNLPRPNRRQAVGWGRQVAVAIHHNLFFLLLVRCLRFGCVGF